MPPNTTCDNEPVTPPATYGPLDSLGRATSATRQINLASTRPSTGNTGVTPSLPNLGFVDPNTQDRSHLLAYVFGGATKVSDVPYSGAFNIVALFQQANRQPLGMARYERQILARIKSPLCETINLTVTAYYATGSRQGSGCAPTYVVMNATGNEGYVLNQCIPNNKGVTGPCPP